MAAPVRGAGAGEVEAPVGGVELTRGVAEAVGFAAAATVAILAAMRRREYRAGDIMLDTRSNSVIY